MTFNRDFFTSPTGQVVLVAAVLFLGVLAVRWQQRDRKAPALPNARPAPSVPLPTTRAREVARFPQPTAVPGGAPAPTTTLEPAPHAPRELPLLLFAAPREIPAAMPPPVAPYGRLIPCQTVLALESNRLETPVIGLVTENVWHGGRLVVPAGAEIHGRAALDRTRERIAAEGQWRIVWRTQDRDNGTEISVDGVALDREFDPAATLWGEHDGSAGLRGYIVRTDSDRELKLFAATFLATATAALQDGRPTAGLLGEASLPIATARNAVLAGTGAILREYGQTIREAIARDGFYLRVPAGKPFYLYVTEPLQRNHARTPVSAATNSSRS